MPATPAPVAVVEATPTDPPDPNAPPVDDDDDDDDTTRQRAARDSLAAVRRGASSTVAPAPAPTPPRWRTFGEFAYDVYRGRVAPAQRDAMYRALSDVTSADVPGIMPPAQLRRMVQNMDAAMPLVAAWSSIPLPAAGMTVVYPSITQRPLVDVVAGEKVAIPSRDTKIAALSTPVETFAGGEDTSIQVLERSDPSYWSLAYQLYLREMALKVEAAAGTALVAAAPGAGTGIGTDPTKFNAGLAALAAAMFTSSGGVFPDTMTVGIGVWEAFAGAADTDGRPLFPGVSPVNPVGSTSITTPDGQARGLTFAVSAGLPADTGVLGSRDAFVSMLGPVGTLMADNPEKLGRDSAVYRFGAFAALDPTALVEFNLGVVVPLGATSSRKSAS